MKTEKTVRWPVVFAVGLLCGVVVAVAYYQILRVLDARRHQKISIVDAVGVYSWDLTRFYPPGSPEAKAVTAGMTNYLSGMETDRPLYMRLPGPGGSVNTPLMWDFKASPELLKKWQEEIRANRVPVTD